MTQPIMKTLSLEEWRRLIFATLLYVVETFLFNTIGISSWYHKDFWRKLILKINTCIQYTFCLNLKTRLYICQYFYVSQELFLSLDCWLDFITLFFFCKSQNASSMISNFSCFTNVFKCKSIAKKSESRILLSFWLFLIFWICLTYVQLSSIF